MTAIQTDKDRHMTARQTDRFLLCVKLDQVGVELSFIWSCGQTDGQTDPEHITETFKDHVEVGFDHCLMFKVKQPLRFVVVKVTADSQTSSADI